MRILFLFFLFQINFCHSLTIRGSVQVQNLPVEEAEVTLWQTKNFNEAVKVHKTFSRKDGKFMLSTPGVMYSKDIYYITTENGKVDGAETLGLVLMAIVGKQPPGNVVVNEFTTIGSVWPNAQMLTEFSLQGSRLGLETGASQVSNLVNLSTGNYGKALLDPENVANSETLARINTLANLVSLCGLYGKRAGAKKFLSLAGERNSLFALQKIARSPWRHAEELFYLFEKEFPLKEGKNRREDAYLPYLQLPPRDFSLSLRFSGGGICAPGKIALDAHGNVWSGQNWMPGSQSNLFQSIGGGLVKLHFSGKALSPPILGFSGQGISGIGWGTAVTEDKVWVGSFSKNIGVYDLDGKSVGPEQGINFNGRLGMLQGACVAKNGDVWFADATNNQMICFEEGNPERGKIVRVPGLNFPFGVASDAYNRVWVTNSQSSTVVVFHPDNPEKAESIHLNGHGLRGIAIDSKGNAWVCIKFSSRIPFSQHPAGPDVMQEFKMDLDLAMQYSSPELPTGTVALISPQGKVIASTWGEQQGIYIPWGISIDGNDNVWIANFMGEGVVHMRGTETFAYPQGKKHGEIVHVYTSGVFQKITDVAVDAAGNLWIANNWDNLKAVNTKNANRNISTKAAGQGICILYGVAAPVKLPLMGPVRKAETHTQPVPTPY